MRVSTELESAMWRAVRECVPADAYQLSNLHRAVSARSRLYTSCRERLAEPGGPADLAARALFFSVADSAKIELPLAELAFRGALPDRASWRVLDLGAGPGAMSLGLAAWLARTAPGPVPAIEVVAVDRDRDALAIMVRAAAHLAEAIGVTVSIDARVADVTEPGWAEQPFDLIVAGTVLNELPDAARLALATRSLRSLDPAGAIVLIEPALRATSRALSQLRDQLVSAGEAEVVAPCTRTQPGCPALIDPDDWCHEDRPLELSPALSDIARITGLRDSGAKFSYLVLRRPGADIRPLAEAASLYRIVSRPRRSKGQRACIGCGEAGWVPLRLLKRHRHGGNRSFERVSRGDILAVRGPALSASGDLTGEHSVDRIEVLQD